MLNELLSQSSYQSYNIKLANVIGLHEAIYFNILTEMYDTAYKNNSLNSGCITIDRDIIKKLTTFDKREQGTLEKQLLNLGLISYGVLDTLIKVNYDTLVSMFTEKNESITQDLSKARKVANKEAKAESILAKVKKHININYPAELQLAYSDWLETLSEKNNFVSKQALFNAENTVDKFANGNINVALEVIRIASAHGWIDMDWAINNYNNTKNIRQTSKVVEVKNIELGKEEF